MRLIDADELKKALAEMWYENNIRITGLSVAELIDEAPTIEPSKSADQNVADVPSGDEYVPNKACFDCMERATGMCKGTIQEQSWCPYVAKINTEPNEIEHDGCSGCRWEHLSEDAYPCKDCKQNYTDKYETLFARPETIKDRNELLYKIQSQFGEEEARAFADQTKGLKEHAVWNKAIRILEEYIV